MVICIIELELYIASTEVLQGLHLCDHLCCYLLNCQCPHVTEET